MLQKRQVEQNKEWACFFVHAISHCFT